MVPDFPGLCGLHVCDGSLLEVNGEAEEMKIIHGFKLDRVAEKVVVNKGLDAWM